MVFYVLQNCPFVASFIRLEGWWKEHLAPGAVTIPGEASVPFVTLQALAFTNSISVSAHNPRVWNTQQVKNRLSNSKVH